MNIVARFCAVGVAAFGVTLCPATAETALAQNSEAELALQNSTVVCMKNVTDQGLVSILQENRRGKTEKYRTIPLAAGKTSCARYADVNTVLVHFMTELEVRKGFKFFMGDSACDFVRRRAVKFFVFSIDEEGAKSCVLDEAKTDEKIRGYVRNAKPIG